MPTGMSYRKGAAALFAVIGLTLLMGVSLLVTSQLNNRKQTVQSRAAGRCGDNCDNKGAWISDCKKYNGEDKGDQCNNWFNVECSGCDKGDDDKPDDKPQDGSPSTSPPYDPGDTANNPDIQNFCGANPNDSRCCKINEWKNANTGTNLKDCSGGSGGKGDNKPSTAPSNPPASPVVSVSPAPSTDPAQFSCGGAGQKCCEAKLGGAACRDSSHECNNNTCQAKKVAPQPDPSCGGKGEKCCFSLSTYSSSCNNSDYECRGGTCQKKEDKVEPVIACGGTGESCCTKGNACDKSTDTCTGGICKAKPIQSVQPATEIKASEDIIIPRCDKCHEEGGYDFMSFDEIKAFVDEFEKNNP